MSCRVSAVVVFMVGFCVADVEGREKVGICWPSYGDRGSLRIDSGDREGAGRRNEALVSLSYLYCCL